MTLKFLNRKIPMSQCLASMCYFCYIFWKMLYASCFVVQYGQYVHYVGNAVKMSIIICVAISTVKSLYQPKELFAHIIILLTGGAVAINTDHEQLMIILFLLVISKDSSFRVIVKTAYYAQIFSLLFIIASSVAGIVPDELYNRSEVNSLIMQPSTMAHSCGFTYYTSPAYLLLAIMMEWGYLNFSKSKVKYILVWLMIQLLGYRIFTSRASFLMAVLYLFMFFFCTRVKYLRVKNIFWNCLATIGYPLMMIVNIILIYQFYMNNEIAIKMNGLLNGRFEYSIKAFFTYGINAFGNDIEMTGAYEVLHGLSNRYFYIDSGYLYCLFAYGMVFSVVILTAYSGIFRNAQRRGAVAECFWLTIYMIMNLNNNMLISIHYNPLLFMLPLAITMNTKAVKDKKNSS